ncbi:Putative Asparagine synthetase [Rhizopus microsporus]|nr:Putative Asparagine synthetase [Rhizopus microsporus]
MCGFSAYFHFDSTEPFKALDLETSLQYIQHRGPDSNGIFVSDCGRCGLGHARLSIIDLTGGQQPLSNASKDIHAVVNGELYDFERIRAELEQKGYSFKTKSDSEIVLPLYEEYGLSFLEHLRGEFAVCIFDSRRNRFIIARDRFGIKPLFYTIQNGTLLVASEMKAFIPMGLKAEWNVDCIMNGGELLGNKTCLKGVYKLPPAHYLVAQPNGFFEIRSYWDADYPEKNVKDTRSVDEMIQGVRERLMESIRLRLRADVPVGVYLSGGIDSSCVAGIATAILREKNPQAKIKAFTISFKDSKDHDESAIADRTAQFIDADFEKLELTENDLLENFEESVWHIEAPQINLNGVGKFMLSKLVRDRGYKVVLTGEGSDEHFAGYTLFYRDYLREPDNAGPEEFRVTDDERAGLSKSLLETLGKNAASTKQPRLDDYEELVKTSKAVNGVTGYVFLSKVFSLTPKNFKPEVFQKYGQPNPALNIVETINGIARAKANKKWHPLHTSLYIENHTMLPNYLCNALGDRSEMAHSVEARTPFLDHPLCEYVNGLPPSVKIKIEKDGNLNEKWILKEAVKPYITEEIYKRIKHPYIAPSSQGKGEVVTNLINRLLSKENIERLGWASYEKVYESKQAFFDSGDMLLFKDMLMLMSYVIISQRFNVAPYSV